MATPTRSPILGYNHNLKYRGRVFHVQTEDSGPGHPRIFTHLYYGGSIVASKRHEYDAVAPADIVRGLMQSQHKSILRDLKSGRHDAQLIQFFAKRGEELDGPDDSAEMPALEVVPADAAAAILSADTSSAVMRALSNESPIADRNSQSVSPEVLAQFAHAFDDEPAHPDASPAAAPSLLATAHVQPSIPVRPIPPAAPASSVTVERSVPVGQTSAANVGPTPTRPRRPGHSIPYVVQQGSHPVASEGEQEVHAPTLTMPAAPIVARPKRPTEPGVVAKAEAAKAVTKTDVANALHDIERADTTETDAVEAQTATSPDLSKAPLPLTPPAPLDPAGTPAGVAPLTAASVGALPTEVVSREDNQSLDEVIMAYLARGVEDEHKEDEHKTVGG